MPGTTSLASLRVVVIDDDAFVRSGVHALLATAPEVTIIAEFATGPEAVAALPALGADLVLLDVRMPEVDGLATLAALRAAPRTPPVLMMTAFDEDGTVLDAVRGGADGFVFKDESPDEFVAAVRATAQGDAHLSRRSAAHLVRWAQAGVDDDEIARAKRLMAALSPRERELATALIDGPSNAELAARLHFAEATVKKMCSELFVSLGATNRTQVAVLAVRAGLDRG